MAKINLSRELISAAIGLTESNKQRGFTVSKSIAGKYVLSVYNPVEKKSIYLGSFTSKIEAEKYGKKAAVFVRKELNIAA